jgi:hypothetical protein
MGNGTGYSNRQVIETVRQVTGRAIPVLPADRRPGDPARLVAGAERIREELGWVPRYPDLATMVQTAWRWRRHHPEGYRHHPEGYRHHPEGYRHHPEGYRHHPEGYRHHPEGYTQ